MRADSGGTPTPAARLPELHGREPLPDGIRLRFTVPPDQIWFADHFPSRPVLPGVAQIAWAIAFARGHFGFDHDPVAIDRVKFLETVPLGEPLLLELQREGARVNWQLLAEDRPLSRGRMTFRTQ